MISIRFLSIVKLFFVFSATAYRRDECFSEQTLTVSTDGPLLIQKEETTIPRFGGFLIAQIEMDRSW